MKSRNQLKNILVAIFVTIIAVQVYAAKEPTKRRAFNPLIHKVAEYALPEESPVSPHFPNATKSPGEASLGDNSISSSPGEIIGATHYEMQHINTTGRMVGIGRNISGIDTSVYVHFTWMSGSPSPGSRGASYVYAGVSGGLVGEMSLFGPPGYGGYFNLDVTPNNQAIISGHYTADGNVYNYAPTVWYDGAALDGGFEYVASIPQPLWQWAFPYTFAPVPIMWPHLGFQTMPDGSHVTHLTGTTASVSKPLFYFRKEGNTSNLAAGELSNCPALSVSGWDCPFVYDTAWATVALVTASKQSGKVALTWTANLPDYTVTPGCDTCSVNSSLGSFRNTYENDMYYQTSDDYGVTWNPMQNVTHNNAATADWMPYNDIDALWDTNDELHIAWVASDWRQYREEGNLGYGARIFHWMENYGNTISDINAITSRTAVAQNYDPILCNAGANNLNLAKPQLSECNSNLYCLFVDLWDGHDDPNNPDCSYRGYDGDPYGSVNGELMVSISDNNGMSWDLPHNLTNSPSPDCDSIGGAVGPCDSDHWPSMPPHGFAITTADGAIDGVMVLPRAVNYPNVPGTEWLPIMYINDQDPGVNAFNDGSIARDNPVRSFYMACVAPDQFPTWGPDCFGLGPDIGWPTFVHSGEQLDVTRILENSGNSPVSYSLIAEEDNGPSGWLTLTPTSGTLGTGVMNKDTVTIQLNASAFPGGPTFSVFGRIILEQLGSATACTVNVNMIVTDTIYDCDPDTISTGSVSLGLCCRIKLGSSCGPGMDYWYTPEGCDTVGSVLYDGSLIVGGIVDGDTLLTNQFYMQEPGNENTVYQLTAKTPVTTSGIIQYWRSGILTNHDTTLGMEISYYAPQVTAQYGTVAGKSWYADQQFITREFKVWSMDDQPHPDLVVGEVIDWNLPSDSGSANQIGTSAASRLIYMRGAGNGQPECPGNGAYFAGMAFGYFKKYDASIGKWSVVDSVGYGGFHGVAAASWEDNELYEKMEPGQGYVPIGETLPFEDYYIGLTYAFDYDLNPNDTLCFYSVLTTVRDDLAGPSRILQLAERGRNFTRYFGCCRDRKGDLNGDGADCNIIDLNYQVNYLFRAGPAPTCMGEADVNSDRSPGDIVDLNFIVNRIFRGGAQPQNCGNAL